jgi:hypothetical protein
MQHPDLPIPRQRSASTFSALLEALSASARSLNVFQSPSTRSTDVGRSTLDYHRVLILSLYPSPPPRLPGLCKRHPLSSTSTPSIPTCTTSEPPTITTTSHLGPYERYIMGQSGHSQYVVRTQRTQILHEDYRITGRSPRMISVDDVMVVVVVRERSSIIDHRSSMRWPLSR